VSPVAAAAIFIIAVGLSMTLTVAMRALAPRLKLLDRPDNHRKLHGRPMALGGGVAVFLTTVIVLVGLLLVPNPWQERLCRAEADLLVWFGAALLIVCVGLLDDRFRLIGRYKLLGQIATATLLAACGGLMIQRVQVFGLDIDLGLLAFPFTVFWLLGAINSVNLLDGIDGLAAMLGFILVTTIGVMAFLNHHPEIPIVALVFGSSLLGFLVFNFPPASIFLGDSGSMLIGLLVGALAIRGALKGPGTVLLAAPLAVWTLPIFDSLAAILRRKLTGRSIYATDRGHLHHRLLDLLGSNRRVLACVAVFCAVTSLATLASVALRSDLIALVSCSAIVVILMATGLFGRAELALLTTRLHKFSRSLIESAEPKLPHAARQAAVRLQGHRPWESLWGTLTEAAEKLALTEIQLEVHLPRVGEGYHAYWDRPVNGDRTQQWRMEMPLVVGDEAVGLLTVAGRHTGPSACGNIEQILCLLEPFETQFRALVSEQPAPVPVVLGGGEPTCVERRAATVLTRSHPK
jgi:UDP-GlcNAc:undecaprenyl-phosphate GlcNAc-1-phosphate transferase